LYAAVVGGGKYIVVINADFPVNAIHIENPKEGTDRLKKGKGLTKGLKKGGEKA
jgi:hypothetical protein